MKINGNALVRDTMAYPGLSSESHEYLHVIDDDHGFTGPETPLRPDAFVLDDRDKMDLIEEHFRKIMMVMGLDLSDDSLQNTPARVARMFIKEIFSGLDPRNKPDITLFENGYHYNEMLVEKNITVNSYCEHHFVPITGKAHVAYISNGKVIGLSKINRLVQYYARRPQVQERLTIQIAEALKEALGTEDVAVYLDTTHMCVTMRGVQDPNSSTVTSSFHGAFREEGRRKEFLDTIR
jgi:GTP cyclohydrolase I